MIKPVLISKVSTKKFILIYTNLFNFMQNLERHELGKNGQANLKTDFMRKKPEDSVAQFYYSRI